MPTSDVKINFEEITKQSFLREVEVSRCTGHCCRVFCLPEPPETKDSWGKRFFDGAIIADMVIYLGYFAPGPEVTTLPNPKPGHNYTCRHLQANGDCGIYETRPRMCQDYPYRGACHHAGCTRRIGYETVEVGK